MVYGTLFRKQLQLSSISKFGWLWLIAFDASFRGDEGRFFHFHADEVEAFFFAGYSGGARTHVWIEDRAPWRGYESDEVSHDGYGLDRGVSIGLTFRHSLIAFTLTCFGAVEEPGGGGI